MERISNTAARLRLKEILAHDGIRPAVVFLNDLANHRFTSLYRFDGDQLHNLFFYDRENPTLQTSEDIPVMASYCVFVRDSEKMFKVEDSCRDERVAQHSKRQVVQSYCGVPLLDEEGKMFGTICHFDLVPKRIATVDLELLEAMAHLLQSKTARLSKVEHKLGDVKKVFGK